MVTERTKPSSSAALELRRPGGPGRPTWTRPAAAIRRCAARLTALLGQHDQARQLPGVRRPPDLDRTADQPTPGRGSGHGRSARTSCWSRSARAGSASVFMAEQTEPVRRKVALKIIKPGMDTRQVVARFEAERQALAIMDHPNIAKVFDGGATPSGRPYFVMELVKGVPITEFCDQNHLTAAAAAGAVRRRSARRCSTPTRRGSSTATSSRPTSWSRVHDTTPVAKVIDFGVAKALGQAADRQDAVHRLRPDGRHAAVHVARSRPG